MHLLALQDKIQGDIPTHHPLMTWLVEHVGEIISKYTKGSDGRTPLERLLGKPCREEALEFGEKVWFRSKKSSFRTQTNSRKVTIPNKILQH